jgi:hypothetical protein
MAQFRFLNIAAPGGIINPMSGGTGVANNNANTITLGGPILTAGAFTLAGAFGSTFTFTGTTNVTFPTSGTLATTSQLPALPLSLSNGGTGAALVANNGGMLYSTGSAAAILAGTATPNQVLLSGSNAAPSWSTATLTLGGNVSTAGALTLSGAFGVTFTFTNTTSVTFPTSGTLATTSQIPSFPLSLANGGTNANLTANNGGILYSTSTAAAILAGTITAGQLLTSGASTTPAWTTSTYPATNAINTLLYASAANVMAALATANSSVLVTSSGGVPSLSTTLPAALTTTSMQINTVNVGASGTAGSMNLFSGTASKGKWLFTPVDNTGNTTMTITNAAQGGAYTYTIPNAGASASFMMTQGNQTAVGNNTFSGTTQINALNIGASGTAGTINLYSSTASSGSIAIVPVANSGNFVTTITTQAEGGAYTYTIPSSGANAGFLMSNSANGTESGGAVSVTALSGFITSQSLSVAAGSSHAMTFTNGYIASTSKLIITKAGGTNTRHNYQIESVSNSGNATVTIYNTEPTNAMNGTIIFSYFVIP